MRAIVLIILALNWTAVVADNACTVLKDSAGQVLKAGKGHALVTCILTADNKWITADSTMPINGHYLATEDGKPIKTEDGKLILLEGAGKK